MVDFCILKVKGQLHYDITLFSGHCPTLELRSRRGDREHIFHLLLYIIYIIWSGTELVTLILGF